MLDRELLEILCCPETHQDLAEASAEAVAVLNRGIAAGTVVNRAGAPVSQPVAGLLVRQDGRYGYPVRDDIPVMLIDEAVPLEPSAS